MNQQSSPRSDELARRILLAANYPIDNIKGNNNSPTPHLDELERALEIKLPPLTVVPSTNNVTGVQTCTVPGGATTASTTNHRTSNDTSTRNAKQHSNELWSWTPSTNNNTNNTYDYCGNNSASSSTLLEDCLPFTPQFYKCCADLVCEGFHPGSSSTSSNTGSGGDGSSSCINNANETESNMSKSSSNINGNNNNNVRHSNSQYYTALQSLEQYSLPRMHDGVRITRILLALHELQDSFLDELLHNHCDDGDNNSNNDSNNDSTTSKRKASRRIQIITALFHHWTNLPQLEQGIHQLIRKYSSLLPNNAVDFWEYTTVTANTIIQSQTGTSIGDGGNTGGEWKSKSSTETSFLGSRALRIDSFRSRLETELHSHIHGHDNSNIDTKLSQYQNGGGGGLTRLLCLVYKASNGILRGKLKKLMGQRLRMYALGNSVSYKSLGYSDGIMSQAWWGLGPSFAVFCPLVTSAAIGSTDATDKKSVGTGTTAASSGPISLTQLDGGGGGVMMPSHSLGVENTSACGIAGLLQVLLVVIRGFNTTTTGSNSLSSTTLEEHTKTTRKSNILQPSHENLLFEVLIPLHRPSGMVLWRDQTPLIGLYHEPLVKCIGALLHLDSTLVGSVVDALLHPDIWPTEGGSKASNGAAGALRGSAANTPKVVLLIHEVDTLISAMQPNNTDGEIEQCLASFDSYVLPLAIKLCSCISSDNSRTSERALQLFKNSVFKRLVERKLNEVGPHFLRALCRVSGGTSSWEIPWNPTVRKMTLLVLRELEALYNKRGDDAFENACDESLNEHLNSQPASLTAAKQSNADKPAASKRALIGSRPNDVESCTTGNLTSLRSAMGSWRPPSQKGKIPKSSSQSGTQPPSTITGVAPWSVGAIKNRDTRLPNRGSSQPPLTITGVAPWAITQPSTASSNSRVTKRQIPNKTLGRAFPSVNDETTIVEEDEDSTDDHGILCDNSPVVLPALKKVHAYMEKLKSPEDDKSHDGVNSWTKAQMQESPVLLPGLKFHDLVFGQDLGTGAFSTVRYARHIVKDRTRSKWPEYAVKIVSTRKIEELGYFQSINREIAILRVMSHPGISRLISSFRFRDGAYLVLEYASGGDLHTLLRKNGSLDHESTKFVIGSVAAALSSVHERGFVYADCKPEVS
eukprot:scaffold17771_cov65-Cyclotella_meneghiniana.AAC.6